jgi:hypothetical protein
VRRAIRTSEVSVCLTDIVFVLTLKQYVLTNFMGTDVIRLNQILNVWINSRFISMPFRPHLTNLIWIQFILLRLTLHYLILVLLLFKHILEYLLLSLRKA